MLHQMVRCNIRDGMQAAIAVHMWITSILVDGLWLRPVNAQHFARWQQEYETVHREWTQRWTKEEWREQGYILIQDKRPIYRADHRPVERPRVDLIPHPVRRHG